MLYKAECYFFSSLSNHLDLTKISYSDPKNWEDKDETFLLKELTSKINLGVKCFYILEPNKSIKESISNFKNIFKQNNERNEKFEIGIVYKFEGEFLDTILDVHRYSLLFRNEELKNFEFGKVYPIVYRENPKDIKIKYFNKYFNSTINENLILPILLIKDKKFQEERECRIIKNFISEDKIVINKNEKEFIYFEESKKPEALFIFLSPKEIQNTNKKDILLKLILQASEEKIKIYFLNKNIAEDVITWYKEYIIEIGNNKKYKELFNCSKEKYVEIIVEKFNNLKKNQLFRILDEKAI